jgi:hypothetical protein
MLADYELSELQEIIEYIVEQHELAVKGKNKEVAKHWKDKYKEVAAHYNERAGSSIWQKQLYD